MRRIDDDRHLDAGVRGFRGADDRRDTETRKRGHSVHFYGSVRGNGGQGATASTAFLAFPAMWTCGFQNLRAPPGVRIPLSPPTSLDRYVSELRLASERTPRREGCRAVRRSAKRGWKPRSDEGGLQARRITPPPKQRQLRQGRPDCSGRSLSRRLSAVLCGVARARRWKRGPRPNRSPATEGGDASIRRSPSRPGTARG